MAAFDGRTGGLAVTGDDQIPPQLLRNIIDAVELEPAYVEPVHPRRGRRAGDADAQWVYL